MTREGDVVDGRWMLFFDYFLTFFLVRDIGIKTLFLTLIWTFFGESQTVFN